MNTIRTNFDSGRQTLQYTKNDEHIYMMVASESVSTNNIKPYYGDLVRAVAFTVIVPVSAYDVIKTGACDPGNPDPNICTTALYTVLLVTLTCVLSWLSYLKHSNVISFMAYLSAIWVCAFININQWPYSGECVITNMFQGALFGNLCNGELTFRNHIVRMIIMFVVASYVSIHSPFSVYTEDVLPLLGGPILMATVFLACTKLELQFHISHSWAQLKDTNWNYVTVQASRWVLSAIYMYHVGSELLSMSFEGLGATEIFRALVKASVIAGMGVAATGSFQNEIDTNAKLEVMVRNRTKIIQEKNDKLHMVELALECSETAIVITDSNLRIIWLNAACEDISSPATEGGATRNDEDRKQKRESLLGKFIVEALALETLTDEKKLSQSFCNHRKEDEVCIKGLIFHLEVSPYEYSSSTTNTSIGRFLVVLKNTTAEKAREVAEKAAQEEAMLAKAMGDSMVTLTHELRTPMQGIMGVTGMVLQQKQDEDDPVLVESLRLIMASSGLLLNLINNLLDVKKVNSEMMDEFPLSSITASSAIQDTIDFCQPLASISGVRVVTEYGDNSQKEYKVVSNSLRLQQILINLVSNAIKYTAEQSKIVIRIQSTTIANAEGMIENSLASSCAKGGTKKELDLPVLCFSISDCGPGIAPHQADRLFRRFARLDNKPTRALGGNNKIGQPSGTGLGLNLCQLFVQRMKGEIWAENNINGTGSTFSFFLPLATEQSTRAQTHTPNTLSSKRCRSFEDLQLSTTQLRVLLVDDVLINRKVIGRMVKQVGVSNIVTADSGESALNELSENEYDLVITDLQMPGMSGTDLCRSVLSGGTHFDRLPVVVGLTADTSTDVAKDCRASGMSQVLYKPISVVEMMEFFDTTVTRLRPGVWDSRGNGNVLSAQ